MKFIPESSYDKSIKAYIRLNEIKHNLKISRQEKLTSFETKFTSLQEIITNETEKAINILKTNEKDLTD